MKKLITILTVMIVLVGAAFAAETPVGTAKIDVTATITAREPNFRLAVTAGENYTLGNPSYSDVAETPTAGSATINPDALKTTGNNVTVNFAIQQIAEAVTYKKYYFTVNASVLELQEDANNTVAHIAEMETASKTITVATATPTITAATIATVTKSDDGVKISQKYNGIRVNATSGAPVAVGTFSVVYNGNTEAVPGTYKGDVTLTVTVE